MRGDVKSNNEDKHVIMSRVWGSVFVNTVNAVIYILRMWQVNKKISSLFSPNSQNFYYNDYKNPNTQNWKFLTPKRFGTPRKNLVEISESTSTTCFLGCGPTWDQLNAGNSSLVLDDSCSFSPKWTGAGLSPVQMGGSH